MFKKIAAVSLLTALPVVASAEWVGGISYSNWDFDGDISLNSLNGSIGYKLGQTGEGMKFIPEFRYGIGIGDDSFFGADIEIDNFVGLSAKGQYDFTGGGYIFAMFGWADVEFEASGPGGSASGGDDETGFGLGAGVQFSESVSSEITFENYDETDIVSLGVKVHF